MDNIDHVAEIMKGHKDDMVVKISDTEIKNHDASSKTMNLSQFNHLTSEMWISFDSITHTCSDEMLSVRDVCLTALQKKKKRKKNSGCVIAKYPLFENG